MGVGVGEAFGAREDGDGGSVDENRYGDEAVLCFDSSSR